MQETLETRVPSLGWKGLRKEGLAIQSSRLAWRISWTEEPGDYSPWGHEESDTTEVTEHACIVQMPGEPLQREWGRRG